MIKNDRYGFSSDRLLSAGATRKTPKKLSVDISERFPAIETGRLRFADGLWFDAKGDGDYVKALDGRGLFGAFVEHEDGY